MVLVWRASLGQCERGEEGDHGEDQSRGDENTQRVRPPVWLGLRRRLRLEAVPMIRLEVQFKD